MSNEAPELREFQRRSRNHACRVLLSGAGPGRFLVADEVGLGKTRVARGVIEEVEALHATAGRGRAVVYIAANAEIGRQNGKVLRGRAEELDLPSRPSLLPLYSAALSRPGLHVLAFTPTTALRLRRGTGTAEERALLLVLLRRLWRFRVTDRVIDVFRVRASRTNFWNSYKGLSGRRIDARAVKAFHRAVRADETLRDSFKAFNRPHTPIDGRGRNSFIGKLRELLARMALQTLRPDLIILDEFQKFRWVLEEADVGGTLSNQLLGERPALLLSATPYRMTARAADDGLTDDDLLPLLRFLYQDAEAAAQARTALVELRWALERVRGDESDEATKSVDRAIEARRTAQELLSRVMCRSERPVGSSSATEVKTASLRPEDVRGYIDFQSAVDKAAPAAEVSHRQTIEYWKSAPFLFTFMRDYEAKRALREAQDDEALRRKVVVPLSHSRAAHLDWRQIRRYEPIQIPNGRTRALKAAALEEDRWKLLWVPPSASPYELAGPFQGQGGATKQLVFSGWEVVPTSVSAMVGYEAERRSAPRGARNDKGARRTRSSRRPLDFRYSRSKGASGTFALALCYPAESLAAEVNPYDCASDPGQDRGPSLREVLKVAEGRIATMLRDADIPPSRRTHKGNPAWYWLAPLLLDDARDVDVNKRLRQALPRAWASRRREAASSIALRENLNRAAAGLRDPASLGPPPRNLARVLAELAIGGPGPVALRSLCAATAIDIKKPGEDVVGHAARIAWALRGLLGRPDATWVIQRSIPKQGLDHWRRVLRYCCEGGLAPTMDEYLHLIRDDEPADTAVQQVKRVADHVALVAGLEPLLVRGDDATAPKSGRLPFKQGTLASRFAAPFGATTTESESSIHPDTVRRAFNSPFWPWVLVTTSVGQEGLDFHRYCHQIVHWNVPVSPVELEQREGRVRRFLSHGVRKNLATEHAGAAWTARDPWVAIRDAGAERSREQGQSAFSPEWVYGEDRVKATVLVPPFSRDAAHWERVRKRRVYYRLALGQPNPHELVESMVANLSHERAEELLPKLHLDLAPTEDQAD